MNAFEYRRRWIALYLMLAVAAGFITSRTLLAQAPATEDVEVVVVEDEAPTVPAGEIKTVAVIACTSYSNLVADVGFAGSLADRPELGQMIDGMLAMFTQGKGLAGVDKSKPWGVILQTDGNAFLPVGCLPVTDLGQTLQIVQGFNLPVQDGGDGVKQISLPNGQTLHIKEQNGWAFLSNTTASFGVLPADPSAALTKLVSEYDLGAQINAQNVPEIYRQQIIGAMKGGMEQGLERKEGEDDADYEARRQMAEVQMKQFEQLADEISEIVVGLGLDATEQRAFGDFTYRFVPDSKMAKQLGASGQSTTNFAGFFQPDAAVTFSFASKTDPAAIQENIEQMRSMMASMRKQAEKAIDEEEDIPDDETRDAVKAAMNDMADAMQATMEAGVMDGGGAMEMAPDSLTAAAGMLVKDPAKFESGLKKLAAIAEKEPEFSGVQWNAASHEGINFHTLSVPVPADDEDARRMFGEKADVAIGIGAEAVYVGVGKDNLEAVKKAIDASKGEPNKAVPQFEFSLSLGPVMATAAASADEDDRATMQAIADMLNNDAQGRDHVRMTAKLIENGLTYRFEAEEGVLRAIGKGIVLEQQKAQQEAMQGIPGAQ